MSKSFQVITFLFKRSHKLSDILPNIKNTTEFVVTHHLFKDEDKQILGILKPNDKLELLVHIGGGVRMVKLVPKQELINWNKFEIQFICKK